MVAVNAEGQRTVITADVLTNSFGEIEGEQVEAHGKRIIYYIKHQVDNQFCQTVKYYAGIATVKRYKQKRRINSIYLRSESTFSTYSFLLLQFHKLPLEFDRLALDALG
jgi:hypothetical protein